MIGRKAMTGRNKDTLAKSLVGCATLVLLVIVVAIVVLLVGGAWWGQSLFRGSPLTTQVGEATGEPGDRGQGSADVARRLLGQGGGPGQAAAQPVAPRRRMMKLDQGDVVAEIQKPLTRTDIEAHRAMIDAWDQLGAGDVVDIDATELKPKREDLEADPELAKRVAEAREKAATMGKTLDDLIEEHGGARQVMGRTFRLALAAGAAQGVAASVQAEPWSDRTAEAMETKASKLEEAYDEWIDATRHVYRRQGRVRASGGDRGKLIELTKKANVGPEISMSRYFRMSAPFKDKPGNVAVAQLSEDSLRTWKNLGSKERRELLQGYLRFPLQRSVMFNKIQVKGLTAYVALAEHDFVTYEIIRENAALALPRRK